MCLSVQIVVQTGGKLLSHLQKTFSFSFFPYSTVQNQTFQVFGKRGGAETTSERVYCLVGRMFKSVVGSLCSRPLCKLGTADHIAYFLWKPPWFWSILSSSSWEKISSWKCSWNSFVLTSVSTIINQPFEGGINYIAISLLALLYIPQSSDLFVSIQPRYSRAPVLQPPRRCLPVICCSTS